MSSEEILIKIYGSNTEELSAEQKIQYEKDKKFLARYLDKVQRKIESFSNGNASKYNITEKEYYREILVMTKDDYDPETIITKWVSSTSKLLSENSFVASNLDEFIKIAEENDRKEKECSTVSQLTRECSKQDVLMITSRYLKQIDPTMQLFNEFINLLQDGRIQFETDDRKSYYDNRNDIIHYNFDGTIETANTLIHEFIHRVHFKHGMPNNDRSEYSMFQEYPSIYYENGIVDFMNKIGFINEDEAESLKCSRFRNQHMKTPGKEYLMLLKLCEKQIESGKISEDDIKGLFENTEQDFEQLTQGLVKYCNTHIFPHEHIGLIMYKTSTALANATPHTASDEQMIYKLAIRFIIDKKSDNRFYEELEKVLLKENVVEGTALSTEEIGRKSYEALRDSKDTESQETIAETFKSWKKKILEITQGRE